MNKFIPYGHQSINNSDINAVADALRGNRITQGDKITEFEQRLADYCDVDYAIAFSSGTAALHAACNSVGIKLGDEVITSPITFVATPNAVLYCGGHPIFADIDFETANINPQEIEKHITDKTKAIIPVDYSGHPCRMNEINDIAERNGLFVIEDACHSLGATYKDKRVGGLADMTVFSFHPIKSITTGEGGMVLTDNKGFYEKLKHFRHHGIVKKQLWNYDIPYLGFNYRITDFQCALGISQMSKLDNFIRRRREIAGMYNQELKHFKSMIDNPVELDDCCSSFHLYVIRLKHELDREMMFELFHKHNIGVQVHYIPIYWFSLYRKLGYTMNLCPVAEKFYNCALSLPIYPSMSDEDVERVVSVFKEVLEYVEVSTYY